MFASLCTLAITVLYLELRFKISVSDTAGSFFIIGCTTCLLFQTGLVTILCAFFVLLRIVFLLKIPAG